jgi:hypothetical protein
MYVCIRHSTPLPLPQSPSPANHATEIYCAPSLVPPLIVGVAAHPAFLTGPNDMPRIVPVVHLSYLYPVKGVFSHGIDVSGFFKQ